MAPKALSAILERDEIAGDLEEDMGVTPLSDEDLVRKAKSGDSWAANELFRRYHNKAYSITYAMCSGNSEEAKETLQEAFIKAFQNLNKFREDASFYTWFYRIVVNTCLDKRRANSRWKRLFSFWPSRGPSEQDDQVEFDPRDMTQDSDPLLAVQNKELGRAMRKAIMNLPEKQRAVFHLKVIEGMKIREVAKIMGSAEGTVKTHLFRAIQNLQEALGEWV